MEDVSLSFPTWYAASGASYAAGNELLDGYAEQMRAEGVSWRDRRWRLDTAKQFLRWWVNQDHEEAYRILSAADDGRSIDAAEWELREAYLRHACADRDLRSGERAQLNHFLHYLSAREPIGIMASCP